MLGVTTNYRLHYMQENANLSEHLPEIIEFIDSSLAAGAANRVMVFCRVGQSRSASVCLAYMVIVQRVCIPQLCNGVLSCGTKQIRLRMLGLHGYRAEGVYV